MIPLVPAFKFVTLALSVPIPLMPELAPFAFRVKTRADDEAKLIMPLNVSTTLTTAPLALSDKLLALTEFAPVNWMPEDPAVRTALEAFKTPLAIMPLLGLLAFKMNVGAEEAFNVISPLSVSVMLTLPVELAVRLYAAAARIFTPPLPEKTLRVGADTPIADTPLPAPVAASVIAVPALRLPARLRLPAALRLI